MTGVQTCALPILQPFSVVEDEGFRAFVGLVGCNDTSADAQANRISLTKQEKELANGNPNIGAQLLVRKAVLQEIKNAKLTDKEKFELQFVKDEAAVSYYVQKTIGKDIKISDETIKDIYEKNKKQFKDMPVNDARAQIEAVLAQQQQNQKVAEYYNGLVEKYKLNDSLKAEFPQKEEAKKVENQKETQKETK